MKKRYFMIPAAMALLLSVYLSENQLPDGFDKTKVYQIAKDFITRLNDRQYEQCCHRFNQNMQTAMDREKLQNTLDSVLSNLGDFVRFKGVSAVAKRIAGTEYAVCTVKCIYKNGPATFTISLDKNLLVGGLYIK